MDHGQGRENIVITGAALVTCLGRDRESTWAAVQEGRCGMGPMPALETPHPPDKAGGQAVELPAGYRPQLPRESRYLRWAIEAALRDAGIPVADRGATAPPLPYPPQRCGYVLGTTLHGMRAAGRYLRSGDTAQLRDFLAAAVVAGATECLGIGGLAATTCSACSSSLGSIALAVTLLQAGEYDLIVAGGYDTVSEYVFGGFNSLRLVSETTLRPFAKGRAGMKLAEGYGIVVLERAADARARGASPFAAILGCGESADAHHLTQPHPQGDGAARAIEQALRAAGVSPADIDLVAAHATGTLDNDAGEYAALARVFGDDLPRVPVVGFKSHLGHTLGGAGAVELILAGCALRDGVVPACANSRKEDVEFPGLNLSVARQPRALRASLNTSLGFGGANTAVILANAPSPDRAPHLSRPISRPAPPRDVLITGIGLVLPNAGGMTAFPGPDAGPIVGDTGAIPESAYLHLLNARRVRRMSDYVKMTLAATALALKDAAVADPAAFAEHCSVILGSTHGSANYSSAYYSDIVKQGYIGANPMMFAEGVPNAAAAHLSLMLGLKGACQTVIGSRTAGLDALRMAWLRIRCGQWDRAIVGAGEEHDTTVNGGYENCGVRAPAGARVTARPFDDAEPGYVAGAAAVTFILESRQAAEARGATGRGQVLRCASAVASPRQACRSVADVLDRLGRPTAVLCSANGTWIDRAESAGIRHAVGPGAHISAIYGRLAEHFSATPLLSLAEAMVTAAAARETAAIATDFNGPVAGAVVQILPRP